MFSHPGSLVCGSTIWILDVTFFLFFFLFFFFFFLCLHFFLRDILLCSLLFHPLFLRFTVNDPLDTFHTISI